MALDAGDVTKIGIGAIVAIVVIGILLSMLITALIGRVIVLIVVVLLAVFVWVQRSSIEDKIHEHKCHFTFFGVHLDPPQSLQKYCT
jgi:hypothetical protein